MADEFGSRFLYICLFYLLYLFFIVIVIFRYGFYVLCVFFVHVLSMSLVTIWQLSYIFVSLASFSCFRKQSD